MGPDTTPDGCWEWVGAKSYGYCNYQGKQWYAHRLAWTLTFGEIPKGMFVCHICDNPACCRPTHLFLGTNADNLQDASRKGRLIKSEETCQKLSEAAKLRYESEEVRLRISATLKGHPVSEETRQKISKAQKGHKRGRSLEARRKTSESLKGHIVSEETRRKMSEAAKRRRSKKELFSNERS